MTLREPFTIFKQQKCIDDEEPQKERGKNQGKEIVIKDHEGDGI